MKLKSLLSVKLQMDHITAQITSGQKAARPVMRGKVGMKANKIPQRMHNEITEYIKSFAGTYDVNGQIRMTPGITAGGLYRQYRQDFTARGFRPVCDGYVLFCYNKH